MKNKILFCWLGMTDLRASAGTPEVGLGPVAQAVVGPRAEKFSEVVLLSNWEQAAAESYVTWLKPQTTSPITLHPTQLSGPTNFGEIYLAATAIIEEKRHLYGFDTKLVFHLSPGTPAMAAVWILLAKTRFPAVLIESSRDLGVQVASVPFDIAVEYVPDLLRQSERTLERMAWGTAENNFPAFASIVHRSEIMHKVITLARRVAYRSMPVLIEGESGTGKELFARAIHAASPRCKKPMIVINCGAIPAELVEAELFGHEKGAFTGAVGERIGHFEAADGGTIFLDEIGELPKAMQVKLLRTLQEGEIKRIGATTSKKVNIRVIAATNRTLIDEVSAGTFREDLFYRLAVAVIRLPPLRERAGDINLLIDDFLGQINEPSSDRSGEKNFSVSARNVLLQHRWPGNIRELKNTITRAALLSSDGEVGEEEMRAALLPAPRAEKYPETILDQPFGPGFDLQKIINTVAVHYLERGMAENHNNKTNAAKTLGLPSYQTLTNWLKRYGLE